MNISERHITPVVYFFIIDIFQEQLNKDNIHVFNKFKYYSRLGFYPPIYLIEEREKGFCVFASQKILKDTIICEYSGEVDIGKPYIWSDDNDIMTLLETYSSYHTLFIRAAKKSNISRFINGIKNKLEQSVYIFI